MTEVLMNAKYPVKAIRLFKAALTPTGSARTGMPGLIG